MALIRWILGKLILFLDRLFSPKGIVRDPKVQKLLDARTGEMKLYQFEACPFCVKVRRAIKRLGLQIELRDAKTNAHYRDELTRQGGQLQVPCLQIREPNGKLQWMYESDVIIAFLEGLA